ncbi:MAG TPA: hypothetical protein PKN96_12675 [Flavobacterium sp.]|uniref:hypothetical protein n=1 Tax=Flavobacterium sp. TaxID=239 RepID=UPI002CECF10B|nr:hypothetical protein [Flavobacterium sp.]HNP34140.1 hypothetical protein [Flavobacterium sp.]
MKNIILTFTLLIGFTSFSQGLTLGKDIPKPVTYERGRFYIDGEQIPSYQMKKILAPNLHAVKLYREAKSKESLGGLLLGLGITACAVDLAVGLFSDVKYPTAITYAGLGVVVVSIPILSGRRAKMEAAIKSYNDGLKSTTSIETNFDMNAVANQNGVGIQIKF